MMQCERHLIDQGHVTLPLLLLLPVVVSVRVVWAKGVALALIALP